MKSSLLLFIALLFLPASSSMALSCLQPDIAKDVQNENMIIFEGTALKNLTAEKGLPSLKNEIPIHNFSEQTHLISVDKVWKPEDFTDKDIRVVHTPWMSSIFVVNESYLVFAELQDGKFVSSICGNSRPLKNAKKELEFLNKNVQREE